jgi:hypothetical protein
MGGGKGGGGVDTSGLERATQEATALQKEIYDLTREDVQPWYELGTSSVGRLSDLLGLSGGSVMNRGDVYDMFKDQYTTGQDNVMTTGNMYVTPDGRVVDMAAGTRANIGLVDRQGKFWDIKDELGLADKFYQQGDYEKLMGMGYTPLQTGSTQSVTDYDGLNAAVDDYMANQETPDDFGTLLESFSLDKFQEDPGYQYRLDQSQQALERQMAAQGVTLGGAGFGEVNPTAYRAMDELTQGMASQEYGNAYNRYNQDRGMIYDMLMGTAGMGQNSTGIMANAGQNYATNTGNLTTGLASAQLNADLASQAQSGGMFSSLLGGIGSSIIPGLASGAQSAGISAGLAALSDRRMKENITSLGQEDGFEMYEFNYIGDDTRYRGVMAQDVMKTHPEAVVDIDGVLHVDYDRLGIKMEAA